MNQSLLSISGLPLTLTDDGVVFGDGMNAPAFEEKRLSAWRDFFIDPGLDNDTQLYYIYRNALLLADQQRWESLSLRYDLTLLFAGRVGEEPIHTVGHIHRSDGNSVPFPELYTVLFGSALFLLQDDAHHIVYSVHRSAGETIVVPGACGHVTVNTSPTDPLLIANVFTATPDVSDYSLFQHHHGAAWYPVLSETEVSLKANPSYSSPYQHIPAIPASLPFDIDSSVPLYRQTIANPERFSAFSNPSSFAEQLTPQALLSSLE